MPDFSSVEDTLFIPMLGRIYAGEHFPRILLDRQALGLKEKLPKNLKGERTQTQYTLLASAVRSANMDRVIEDFLRREPDGIIVQLGCGLETTFWRNDNGRTIWYEIDLPDVIAYRKTLLPESDRDRCLAADAFGTEWIETIRGEHPDAPLLVTAGGLFHYFREDTVLTLLRILQNDGKIEIIFDVVNERGMKRLSKKYMKQVGHGEATMFFCVDSADDLVRSIGGRVRLLAEEKYFSCVDKTGLRLITALSMRVSDWLNMVKMIHLRL